MHLLLVVIEAGRRGALSQRLDEFLGRRFDGAGRQVVKALERRSAILDPSRDLMPPEERRGVNPCGLP